MSLICHYQTSEEKHLLTNLVSNLKDQFNLIFIEDLNSVNWHPFFILLTFDKPNINVPHIILSPTTSHEFFYRELIKCQRESFDDFLGLIPFNITFSNADGLVLTNRKPREYSFFEDKLSDDYKTPTWILDELKQSKQKAIQHLITSSNDSIIPIHSYYAGQEEGILEIVQDINPLLSSYLKESAQALVPWSDTTSGASISSDIGDKLLEDY